MTFAILRGFPFADRPFGGPLAHVDGVQPRAARAERQLGRFLFSLLTKRAPGKTFASAVQEFRLFVCKPI